MPSSAYYARLEAHQRRFDETAWDDGQLLPAEYFWVEHQEWLASRGYMLRPRYRPGWIPSWKREGASKSPWTKCEDGQYIAHDHVLDATRIHDGTRVALKRIFLAQNPDEVYINQLLSRATHPRNRCLPVLDVLEVPEEDDIVLIIMPFARPWDEPRFETVGEAIEFCRQVFEGLQFMHANNFAHRDCTRQNILMDATSLYPAGHHPIKLDKTPNLQGRAKHHTRTSHPPKYFLADFGLSRRFAPGTLAPPVHGEDPTVPELQGDRATQPCDPFATDIYTLGNVIKTSFVNTHVGFDFMVPLVLAMTEDEPSMRPTIDEVVMQFEAVCRVLSTRTLRARMVQRTSEPLRWWRDAVHGVRQAQYVMRGIPPVPPARHTRSLNSIQEHSNITKPVDDSPSAKRPSRNLVKGREHLSAGMDELYENRFRLSAGKAQELLTEYNTLQDQSADIEGALGDFVGSLRAITEARRFCKAARAHREKVKTSCRTAKIKEIEDEIAAKREGDRSAEPYGSSRNTSRDSFGVRADATHGGTGVPELYRTRFFEASVSQARIFWDEAGGAFGTGVPSSM